uniref:(northern house mosquito) hypothetical protein n=1 Tax=Culex pipiens TaxID=7175 RepID=A0A8D8DQR3_CULPI
MRRAGPRRKRLLQISSTLVLPSAKFRCPGQLGRATPRKVNPFVVGAAAETSVCQTQRTAFFLFAGFVERRHTTRVTKWHTDGNPPTHNNNKCNSNNNDDRLPVFCCFYYFPFSFSLFRGTFRSFSAILKRCTIF